jgi:hypothetical protein
VFDSWTFLYLGQVGENGHPLVRIRACYGVGVDLHPQNRYRGISFLSLTHDHPYPYESDHSCGPYCDYDLARRDVHPLFLIYVVPFLLVATPFLPFLTLSSLFSV